MTDTTAVALEARPFGYHAGVLPNTGPGTRYRYRLDGGAELPDPASRWQPEGVHGPSAVPADEGAFRWTDGDWSGTALADYVIYELHVGTFTPEGTFDAAAERLGGLADLGVTAIELMPLAQFPGERNWGYDGVYPFAVQDSYGGADGLRRLVDAAHRTGLAVVLDVVYNHLGPEGNYLPKFGPYFTDRYRTWWGDAVNVDSPGADEVRRFFVDNAVEWLAAYHVDALRLDAIHGIVDTSAQPFLRELAERVHALPGRPRFVIAESDLGDPGVVRPGEAGGLGHDSHWADDFHHALHALLTGERNGYYQDFGSMDDLAVAYKDAYVYQGQRSPFRDRRHGAPPTGVPAERFVVFAQNHDQVGNRTLGERLSQLVDFESLKLAAAAVLLSPFVPQLFMGEEYGELAPFQYFVSHGDPGLVRAVRRGRSAAFRSFGWPGRAPDPDDPATFERSKLDHSLAEKDQHRQLWELHRELLRLRRTHPALADRSRERCAAEPSQEAPGVLVVRRGADEGAQALILLAFGEGASVVSAPAGRWRKVFDSADEGWAGPGSLAPDLVSAGHPIRLRPRSAAVFEREAMARA